MQIVNPLSLALRFLILTIRSYLSFFDFLIFVRRTISYYIPKSMIKIDCICYSRGCVSRCMKTYLILLLSISVLTGNFNYLLPYVGRFKMSHRKFEHPRHGSLGFLPRKRSSRHRGKGWFQTLLYSCIGRDYILCHLLKYYLMLCSEVLSQGRPIKALQAYCLPWLQGRDDPHCP